ncbi:hypothetical protein BaRGS_00000510 [Batillaria attramentaria]|uniref:Rhodanese domain-containing protein n=1 Tax=Batillaria attramentaria TaxID=370345 RepID=A0ABD0MA07_9CAEN
MSQLLHQQLSRVVLSRCPSYSKWHQIRKLVTKTTDPFHPEVSDVIDVRAPLEYEVDHIPGAVNLPVLDDNQRTEVGTVYSKDSFEARKLGASLVSRNIADHITNYFSAKRQEYCPLVYCWRGGQRSQSLAIVLSQTGFRVKVLDGGYRTYRRAVIRDLEHLPHHLTFKVITGLTGSGKTLLLHTLQEHGAQVLDLEGLARHKGSLLGLWHQDKQPSQKLWESHLRHHLTTYDPARPVWVESESRKVGRLIIPPALFSKMCEGDRVEVCVPTAERIKHILNDYPHWIEDSEALKQVLTPLKKIRGQQMLDAWFRLIDQGKWEEFIESLLLEHYDITYTVSQKKNSLAKEKDVVQMDDLSEKSCLQFVHQVLQ